MPIGHSGEIRPSTLVITFAVSARIGSCYSSGNPC
jgi:hypothetical protein